MKKLFLLLLISIGYYSGIAEGSRTLAPNYGDTSSLVAPSATNNDFAWLEHDGFQTAVDNFLDPDAPADERLFIRLKPGETLRYGIRRIPVRYNNGTNPYSSDAARFEDPNDGGGGDLTEHEYLTLILYDSDGNIVQSTTLTNDNSDSHGAWLDAGQAGVIETVAESLLGPEFMYNSTTYNSGGYNPLEYTNNDPEGEQDFYIAFLQDDGATADIDMRSWYDLWDFSVYDGNEEKPGRLHCKRWGLTAQYFDNLLADECKFYAQVPSVVGGQNQGNYIKEIDLGGLDPFSAIIYANSVGSDGSNGDLNGDGLTDFQDSRMTTDADIGEVEYDLFINNPDIDIYPTTILPTITITDANFYCNPNTGGGEAAIFFETNQVGQIALLVDLNGVAGYQAGTSDVIIETTISTEGQHVIRWDGQDGNDATVPSGTSVTISGRFTAGPIHVPLYDVEQNSIGMNMLDVRPSTSFDLIYWDDSGETTGSSPTVELDGTNTSLHTWTNGDVLLVNTWSFGYYEINTQNVLFIYNCDPDGDGISGLLDEDSDNDGILDVDEGDFDADTDGDNIPDYLDPDVDGDGDVDGADNWVDTNSDGVNDNFDVDLDGIPNAIDLDSDNDGIQDIVEAGGTDSDGDGTVDGFTDVSGGTITTFDDNYTISSGCSTSLISTVGFDVLSFADDQTQAISLPFDFEFFGSDVGPTIYLNSNAWLSFSNIDNGSLNDYSPETLPSTDITNAILFNQRDYNPAEGASGDISYGTSGTAPNRIFVINFDNIALFGGGTGQTVQLQLYETSGTDYEIRVVTTSTSSASQTMGINNSDGSQAFTISGRNNQTYSIGAVECQSFMPDYSTVASGNGVDDTIDGAPLPLPDTDGDGIANYLDIDADNDGIVDVWEAGGTPDVATGRIDGFTDVNTNGWNDLQETVPLTIPDTDTDGSLPDYLDIDADNDGIPDNYEAQSSDSHLTIVAGDTDNNGLLDIYDPNNGGTFLTPEDTDSDGDFDFRDNDADGDGVPDLIEGWDNDINGFGDWDATGSNNDITDEAGYNVDADSDGLWDIFDNNDNGTTPGITNTIGSNVTRQNTDGADKADWQDTDDDNDGALTAGEDIDNNTDWTDDYTQGQGGGATVPDYLFKGDYDGDSLLDASDLDSDNDGIKDTDEANGEPIDPSADADGDGIANYRDADISGTIGDNTDNNGDGIYDIYDSDLDGIPDFLDLDSDNDGLWDAVEAYEGAIPNGLDQTSGQFQLNDPDNDGLMNYIDSSPASAGGNSTLANPDSDGDGLKDYLDIDSDDDGILDLIESQGSYTVITASGMDSDGDGIDDNFDPDNGGTLIVPVNSDGLDLQDYLDTDSDNDNVPDLIEGNDANRDGVADASLSGTDTDNDGLDDAFDTDNGGTLPVLQNTDGIDELDWRDDNDDNDAFLTEDEDANTNGDYSDDNTNGQGISLIPDYLYNGDFDGDGIPDFDDLDDDNDGILDVEEGYDNVVLVNGSLEEPIIPGVGPDYQLFDETNVPGWNTTASDDQIEIWQSNFNGVPSFDGDQHIEINANEDAQLYQDVATEPGTLLYWRIAHRGRSGTDEFKILIGPTSNPVDNGTFATGNTAWVEYSGYYLVPPGQTTTRFGFESVSSANGNASYGNFIDDFSIFATLSGSDEDGDGLPNYLDRDSNNNGIADIIEAGGIDTDGDGEVDSFTDTDTDGLHDPYDADNGGASLISADTDGDGILDVLDLDTDNDGIPDIIEAGGTDDDGDGRLDDITDTDLDGFADLHDIDNGGTALSVPDTDFDLIPDFKDVDSDNDGITDAVENGGDDTNSDGLIDDYSDDADGDGYADSVDPDSGGTPIANADTDGDGIDNYIDLDVDNNGYPDILEVGGTDTDNNGRLDILLDTDNDGIPDDRDVNQTAGADVDGDGIDDSFDVTYTGGNDDDGDGIDNIYDEDRDGNGYSDTIEAAPFDIFDIDGDGQKDFKDIDADNDGIVDVIELGETVNPATGTINGFTDSDNDGLNDAQDGDSGSFIAAITPPNGDTDPVSASKPDFLDIDSDNDGVVDFYEAQTKATLIALTGVDIDKNGLDDVLDPNQGNTLLTPVNTDGTGSADYLDDDADDDGFVDLIEGNNANKDVYGDWDADTDTNFDDTGFDSDTDEDGLLDIFDIENSIGIDNITGSNAAVQDTDIDGIWDFQDIDDDNDGILTGTGGGADTDATNDDPNDIIPDYLYGDDDTDDDGITDDSDLDVDNDGVANSNEDGGTGFDPSADSDGDGLLNFEDSDIDGDGFTNIADTDTDGINTTTFVDSNSDGVIDLFDQDLDGVPDYKDRDSDNDGIADLIENGLTDTNEDGTLDEGAGITDVNGNGLADEYDPNCTAGTPATGNVTAVPDSNGVPDTGDAIGALDNIGAALNADGEYIILNLGRVVSSGTDITIRNQKPNGNANGSIIDIGQSTTGTNGDESNIQTFNYASASGWIDETYTLSGDAQYIHVVMDTRGSGRTEVDGVEYTYVSGGTCGVTGTALTILDNDSDGIDNYLDLDSDNDGIVDNIEAQADGSYVAPVLTDTDGDGIMDVYDEDISPGNAIDPENTDGTDNDDYLDTDSDNDGVADIIEGWDSDQDGYADWDSDNDNDPSDEVGYSADVDSDGIIYLFDANNGKGSIGNITGSNATTPDTDADSTPDYRDNDDDNDGITTDNEDTGGNYFVFNQGGITVPDYLFNPDFDNDGVLDNADGDSDNDGIANVDEYNGATYNGNGPFDDEDGDGIYNYLDDNDVNFTFTDSNGDGVDDLVDFDKDGIPNFFDLDSDDDGILDAIEANTGIVPASNFDTSTGQYTGADGDSDGVLAAIDPNDASYNIAQSTSIANPNTDSDAIPDFLDLDSDNDGITDNREGQTSAGFITITNDDVDNNGIKDVYDPNQGATLVTPTNTDNDSGPEIPDYLDTDSDNDNVLDVIEGFDANKNGYSDLDLDLDADLSDESGFSSDTDGDGLNDVFDNFSGSGISNIKGSRAKLQDTDSDAIPDWRDEEDDSDGINTTGEDTSDGAGGGSDGLYYNDKTQGGGATPDYLFFNDTDNDDVADGVDIDSDNDGITDEDEFNGITYTGINGPFDDDDADGLFNYLDVDATGHVDTNGDGVDDRVDQDLDGIANFLDLDSDNDGIPDGVEANNGSLYAGMNSNGQFPESVSDVNSNGLADAIDNAPDSDLPNPDTDGDGLPDFLDLDSDSDGISDLVEAGGDDFDDDGKLDSFGDTDGDGLGNSVDDDNGGTPHPLTDWDGSIPNYIDIDSEDDGIRDAIEGFYESGPTANTQSYIDRVTAYNLATSGTTYPTDDTGPANGTPDYADDTDGDGLPNLFDPDSPYFLDDDNDGLVNLFDGDQNGVGYGKVNGTPDRDSDGTENIEDTEDTPLPLDFLSFTGQAVNNSISLTWETTNEVNVSHFEVLYRSDEEESFQVIAVVDANNIKSQINQYNYLHTRAVEGNNYYQIREVDYDNYTDYTSVINVSLKKTRIDWTVYPNPTYDVVNIQSNVIIPNSRIVIYDTHGKVVFDKAFSESDTKEISIDLSMYPSGVYNMVLSLPDGKVYQRIMKR